MSYDQIAARLRCPRCGLETRDEWAVFQMRWSFPAECTTYRPGDRVHIKHPKYWSYHNMRGEIDFDAIDRLRILDTWDCDGCGPWNLAMTTLIIEDDCERIASVEAVPLSAETLRAADCVTDQIMYIYREVTDTRMLDDEGNSIEGWFESLIQALAARDPATG
ncbi:MAG TPA: hypothetical protein VGB85_18450 [Nannocystis sp.]|jgi:hypothetical protein